MKIMTCSKMWLLRGAVMLSVLESPAMSSSMKAHNSFGHSTRKDWFCQSRTLQRARCKACNRLPLWRDWYTGPVLHL